MELAKVEIDACVERALAEDLGEAGDVTSRVAGIAGRRCEARIVAKAEGVLAGLPVVREVFWRCDPKAVLSFMREDGDRVEPGVEVLRVRGDAAAVLLAERTALNFLQRLSGVATQTRRYVDAVDGTGASIMETRKTTPGLRMLEKYAVAVGGGRNHRIGLYDQILLKENHFACALPESYESVVARAVEASPGGRPVIAEARDLDEAEAAVRGGAGVVMLDNFEPGDELKAAVAELRSLADELGQAVEIEVSGGITLEGVAAYAAAGVNRISVGALTHSVQSLDLSLLVEVGG